MSSSDEIFDVVNEQDEVVDRRPRSQVHRLGLMHRAAHVLVFNRVGEVYLQKRSHLKDRQPGVWDSSASGHVDSGEDYDTAAARELGEELGVKQTPQLKRRFKLGPSKATDQEHVWVYTCQAEGPFNLDPLEIECGGWFAPAEVTAWMQKSPQEFATALLVIWPRVTGDKSNRDM